MKSKSLNPDDEKRDKILRFLYERHRNARGIQKIPVGIRELQTEMKFRHRMNQSDVASNLDYLIQVKWVKEVVKLLSLKTKSGTRLKKEQTRYKISDIGINYLGAETTFKRPQSASLIKITNIKGVTVLGEGNIVNTKLTDLSRAADELNRAIVGSKKLTDEQKLDAAGDLSTIRTQIAKRHPNEGIIKSAWKSLKAVLSGAAEIADAVNKFGQLILRFFG